MKLAVVRSLAALGCALFFAACRSLDLTPESDPHRAVAGTVKLNAEVVFPPDAVAVVRVIEIAAPERVRPPAKDLPVTDLGRNEARTERVLGEQVIRAPGVSPIPFRVEFEADDATMRRGVNLDVRISQDGKVRYRTLNAHVITLSSLPYPQEVLADMIK